MKLDVRFLGAAGTVTGSCFLIQNGKHKFLIDCGLFQGSKTLKELNYTSFPFEPSQIDFVILTHAHIDHSGLVPKLCKHGFTGLIYATTGTKDLLSYMLPDSGYIQEFEVERLNLRNERRGKEAVEPIYTREDAEDCLSQIETCAMDSWIAASEQVQFRYWNAGHILGSASIEVEIHDTEKKEDPVRFLFSGDIGPEEKTFHSDPEAAAGIDYLVVESTYGDRERPTVTAEERRLLLSKEIKEAMKAGGNLLIPAFAVERTQELLHDINILFESGALPPTPVFLDSPLAIRATGVFEQHLTELLRPDQERYGFRNHNFRFTESVDESMGIGNIRSGAIIIAASGMCDAGRIRHHLRHNLWRPQATVMLVGYQAPGTLGAILEEGASRVSIMGDEIAVRARIRKFDHYSAHADRTELIDWVAKRLPVREAIFLVHGSNGALASLGEGLVDIGCGEDLIQVPSLDERYILERGRGVVSRKGKPRLPFTSPPKQDWHNLHRKFVLDLAHVLQSERSDKDRLKLLKALSKFLGD